METPGGGEGKKTGMALAHPRLSTNIERSNCHLRAVIRISVMPAKLGINHKALRVPLNLTRGSLGRVDESGEGA